MINKIIHKYLNEAGVIPIGNKLNFQSDGEVVEIPKYKECIVVKDNPDRAHFMIMVYMKDGLIYTQDSDGKEAFFSNVKKLADYLTKSGMVYFGGFNKV